MISCDIANGIARLTLNRPPVNALDAAGIDLLDELITQVRNDDAVTVLVLDAVGKVFSAGADVAMMAEFLAQADGPARLATYSERMQSVLRRLEFLPIPSIAVLHATTLGGGLELAMACDIRLAAEGIKLGLPEANLGILPGAGGTQRLARLAGQSFAIKAIASGELFSASDALAHGVVDEVVAPDGLAQRADALAGAIASRDRLTVTEIKRCVRASDSASGFIAETDATLRLAAQPATLARMQAFFAKAR